MQRSSLMGCYIAYQPVCARLLQVRRYADNAVDNHVINTEGHGILPKQLHHPSFRLVPVHQPCQASINLQPHASQQAARLLRVVSRAWDDHLPPRNLPSAHRSPFGYLQKHCQKKGRHHAAAHLVEPKHQPGVLEPAEHGPLCDLCRPAWNCCD
jgi:hypothetical protein